MDYIKIGTLVNTFGLKGEVKILSCTDFEEERFEEGNTVYVENNGTYLPFVVESYRNHKGNPLVSFKDYQDINLIEKYKGCDIYFNMDDIPELEDGYYFFELKGLKVYDEENHYIGEVIEVEETGANNNLRILKEEGNSVLVPFVEPFIVDVDLDEEKIMIHVIEGLL
ncbi:MAG: ribosome maturation factor RimM [Erysipelotrichaceae bacterium]|nr:ribosome maturation factor RimM [Erysipelotrichaceae bacterium]